MPDELVRALVDQLLLTIIRVRAEQYWNMYVMFFTDRVSKLERSTCFREVHLPNIYPMLVT